MASSPQNGTIADGSAGTEATWVTGKLRDANEAQRTTTKRVKHRWKKMSENTKQTYKGEADVIMVRMPRQQAPPHGLWCISRLATARANMAVRQGETDRPGTIILSLC